jgi:hypothetical protein
MACPHIAGVSALLWQEVLSSDVPATARNVAGRLIARARTDPFAASVQVADRGAGIAAVA